TADLPIADVAELVFVRSPHAHARILAIDIEAASRATGVLAVLTAHDMPQLRLHEIHIIPEQLAPLALAADTARFVGDPVAIVVAPTESGGLHVYVSTQWPHGTRIQMARAFGLSLDQVRAQVPAVGGGFGGKSLGGIREHIATAAAARRLHRPVRYIEQRND